MRGAMLVDATTGKRIDEGIEVFVSVIWILLILNH